MPTAAGRRDEDDDDVRRRVEALRRYGILDTPVERDFDDLCRLAGQICGTPIAVINFIDADRQWFKSEVGLGVRELPLNDSLCRHAILEEDTLVVPDTLEDDRFRCNPLCADGPRLRFYAGAVIRTPAGVALGTVCVLDHQPRSLAPGQLEALRTLARQVMAMLELRFQQREAARSAQQVRTTLESITSAFFSLDGEWRFTYVNDAAERLLARPRTDLLGRNVWAEFPAAVGSTFDREYHRAVSTGQPVTFEEFFAPLDRWFEVHAYPSAEGLSVYFHDVSQRVRAEQAARGARDAAEAANRAKDEFLATLSHELRTPLNAILGWTQILRLDGPEDATTWNEGLDVVERNTRSQVQLIEDILDVSRIVSGKLRLDVRPVSPDAVLRAALDAVRPAAGSRAIRLDCVLDPRAGPITGDPDRLQQVFWNLLSNAIKFTPRAGKVQVSLARVNSTVEIQVADSGQGIAPEFLPHVFERFQQADSSSTRTHKGLGLGLAIVRHLVELHGGNVRAASAGVGQGATFRVQLPVALAHPAPDPPRPGARPREHPTAEEPGPRGSLAPLPRTLAGITVVAVDDDAEARTLLQRILTYCGADVTAVGTAEEALRAVATLRPDVLLRDVEMPGEDGSSLIAKVRALGADRGGDTPAAALTAYARAEDRTRALLAGFQLHVPKPVEPLELVAVVANLAARAGRPTPGG